MSHPPIRNGLLVAVGALLLACLLLAIAVLIMGVVSHFRGMKPQTDARWKPGMLLPEGTADVVRVPVADAHPSIELLLESFPPTLDGRIDWSENDSDVRQLAGELYGSLQLSRAAHLWLVLSILDNPAYTPLRPEYVLGAEQLLDVQPRVWLIDDVKPQASDAKKPPRVWEATLPLPEPSRLAKALPKVVILIPVGALIGHSGQGMITGTASAVVVCAGVAALACALCLGAYRRLRFGRWLKLRDGRAFLSRVRGRVDHPQDFELTPENAVLVLVRGEQQGQSSTLCFFHFEDPPHRVLVEDFDLARSPWSGMWGEFATEDRLGDNGLEYPGNPA